MDVETVRIDPAGGEEMAAGVGEMMVTVVTESRPVRSGWQLPQAQEYLRSALLHSRKTRR